MNEAKRVLNDAMKCDRSKDYDRALDLYQSGLDLLLPLMKDSTDAEEKKWITEQVKKHLTRAETLKRLIQEADEAKRPPTAQKMRWLADNEWDAGRYDASTPMYEKALALFRDEEHTEESGEAMVHCAERLELLGKRAETGGKFERPIPLGHKPGEKYVSPIPDPTRWDGFKHKTAKVTKKAWEKTKDITRDLLDEPDAF